MPPGADPRPRDAPSAAPRRIPAVAATSLLLLLAAAGFAGVRGNGFIDLDDAAYLTGNPVVARGLTAAGLRWAFTATVASNWHPLTWLSHMADVELFGLRPAGHHLSSALAHAANTLLLFAALRAMTGALWRSALATAFFAVHPLHVESVAWASERKDVLAAFFALLAILAHLRHARRPGAGRALAVAAPFALALLAKPMPVTLPFLLLVLDWWPLGRWAPSSAARGGVAATLRGALPPARLWLEKAPLLALAAASGAATYAVQAGTGAMAWGATIPAPVRAAHAAVAYVRYLAVAAWPHGLAPLYPYPAAPPHAWRWAGALLALGAVTALALRAAARRPHLATGWLWYLGTLVPVIGLVQVGAQAWADRYTYLPLTGVFVAASWGAADLVPPRRAWRLAAAGCAAAALAALLAGTRWQVRVWRDSVSLFTRALAVTSANAVLHDGLGTALARQGRLDDAVAQFRAALEIEPDAPDTLFNLGVALAMQGRRGEAVAALERALAIDPTHANARRQLARLRAPPQALRPTPPGGSAE